MLAIIGGTGLTQIGSFQEQGQESVTTPYSEVAVTVSLYAGDDKSFYFLPRHGVSHNTPPHKVNYRANIWALKQLGISEIVAINAVGAIHDKLTPGSLAIPDQIIDYSYARESTFFDTNLDDVVHIDFTHPYDETLRQKLLSAINELNQVEQQARFVLDGGVYACTQGPRLETAAEVKRLQSDGCDMIGMTGMPEAALARELEIPYASVALSVNWGAGLSEELISLEDIRAVVDDGIGYIQKLLQRLL